MPEPYTLCRLLEREDEPSAFMTREVAQSVITYPEQIQNIVPDGSEEESLLYHDTRSDRLAKIFHRLQDYQIHHVKSLATQQIADRIAKAATSFLNLTLVHLHTALKLSQLITLLVPALATCLTVNPPSSLREVAKKLVEIKNLLNHLACDNEGGKVVMLWVNSPVFKIQDTETQAQWTDTLVRMVSSCPDSHEALDTVRAWGILCQIRDELSESLKKLAEAPPTILKDTRNTGNSSGLLVNFSSTQRVDLSIASATTDALKKFDLTIPGSERSLANVIAELKGEKTLAILKEIAATFPCSICKKALPLNRNQDATVAQPATNDEVPLNPKELDQFLGNIIGEWKVSLSVSAFKSIQAHIYHTGIVPKKLEDLSSGSWEYEMIGSKQQRSALRVPLAVTKCDQDLLILWQVDVDSSDESQIARQIIKVWAVGKEVVIKKSINRVILIQKSYSQEHCKRCRRKPVRQNKNLLPVRFGDMGPSEKHATEHEGKLDVTFVDPETVDMANKFYAFTKPLMRAIIANNLTAEFPFDLSTEEFKVINHFDTASLLLGRSGTGKTTCLIFKMVSKYLARKAIVDEKPIRQVMLTRSSFLADKLRDYSKRLIEGQMSQTLHLEALENANSDDWSRTTEATTTGDALTLQDEMFPLVSTYSQFLQILENTVRALDRRCFDDNDGTSEDELITVQSFTLDYWPRFPSKITKHLSSHLVFPEILGVIKGSVSSTKTLAPLNLEEYIGLSPRIAPSFPSRSERLAVYTVYQYYESTKKSRGDFDLVDRVVRLVKAIRSNSNLERILAAAFHEIYIDEVQDHQCIDFGLFLSFIKDARGIHCAGDTAQAISQDSTFRFNDPKGLFYEHFAAASKATGQDLSRPKLFTLNKNYRSHQGILAVASLVMELLWKGFPETIDRLDPEIGRLAGPKPVLFLNCTAATFISGTEDDIRFSKRAVEFGAEQVILVRDEQMKEKLQNELGEAALVLTILQSKGMEFDDVVLWNFFGHARSTTTARKLRALYKETAKFDPKKYWSLCSELKHLYVAVTRARMQLFFVESSAEDSRPLINLLTEDVAESLVEVTQPSHALFQEKLMSLLPGDSVDPLKWAARGQQLMQLVNYKDAAMCFRKAGDKRAETVALGRMQEENARRCNASGDLVGFKAHLEAAFNHFSHAGLREDASRCLIRMAEYSHAAKLWLKESPRDVIKAASLYLEANLYNKATTCFRIMGHHREAADALIKGKEHDSLVFYLSRNIDQFNANERLIFARLCKLLLKRNEINPLQRKNAIALLGTPEEQEAAFVQYGMEEDFADLLTDQHRYKELFDLLLGRGNLEQALEIALIGNQVSDIPIAHETIISQLLHYVCTGVFYGRNGSLNPSVLLSDGVRSRLPLNFTQVLNEWSACCQVSFDAAEVTKKTFLSLVNNTVKAIMSFQLLIDPQSMSNLSTFDSIPLEMVALIIDLTKEIEMDVNASAWDVVLLAAGVWASDEEGDPLFLSWSPLHHLLSGVPPEGLKNRLRQWVLSRLSSLITTFETKARGLLNMKWPFHCLQFLVSGFCSKKRRGEICKAIHERIASSECSGIIEDVLQISRILCDLNTLYSYRILSHSLQNTFLPIRRYWLERLLRELTWLSPFEQDASLIRKTQLRLLESPDFSIVKSSLEGLLYHRLGKDWSSEMTYSSILEQMQMSKLFARDVQVRHFRSVSFRLNTSKNGDSKRRHLQRLDLLEWEAESFKPADLKQGLALFLEDVTQLSARNLDAMHSVTSTFEHLALYFLLKTCAGAFIVPQAWLEIYLPRFPRPALPSVPLPWAEKYIYREMLDQLINGFCSIMERLDGAFAGFDFSFQCRGRKIINPSLLQQRNVDFLVIALVNLHANANIPPDHNKAIAAVQKVLNFTSVRAPQLKFKTVEELRDKLLAPSFAAYNGKNPLAVVLKNAEFVGFRCVIAQKGVSRVTFDELRLRMRPSAATEMPLKWEAPRDEDIVVDQLTQAETESIQRLQRRWRALQPKIERRRAWLQTAEAQLVARFLRLGEKLPVTFPVPHPKRLALVRAGIPLQPHLSKARASFSIAHKQTMEVLDNIDASDKFDEAFDNNLQVLQGLGRNLKSAEIKMTDHSLQEVVDKGDVAALEEVFCDVAAVVLEVLQGTVAIRNFLNELQMPKKMELLKLAAQVELPGKENARPI